MNNAFEFSGAGNRFVLLDCLDGKVPPHPAELARTLCGARSTSSQEQTLDGLLLALPPEATGHLKMVLYNADGSRPETCGNGLRCLGRWAWQQSEGANDSITIETDAGLCKVQVNEHHPAVHVNMGRVWVDEEPRAVHVAGREIKLMLANVGNPHAIMLVDDLVEAPVEEVGAALQVHPDFPDGINVEFVSIEHGEAAVRIYERGVGETLACGSGACAVAGVLRVHANRPWPIRVRMAGGVLDVHLDEDESVWLTGPVIEHALDEHSRQILESLLTR